MADIEVSTVIEDFMDSATATAACSAIGALTTADAATTYQPINGKKFWSGLVSQTGSGAPTVTVKENTLGGTVVPSYISTGDYFFTLSGAFPAGRVIAQLTAGGQQATALLTWNHQDANTIEVFSWDTLANALADGLLSGASLEITVYPA